MASKKSAKICGHPQNFCGHFLRTLPKRYIHSILPVSVKKFFLSSEDVKLLRSELNNLRKQNTALNKGIKNLEAEIGESAFKRLVEQVASPESSLVEAEEYSSCTEGK
ncbi:unnamed protein product [Meloidogyne enterolobii]|uniref:Uncharacterized protein n=1 Tax=Meloidogyne enterolobii TaxID=390850 RepID=A0ACB1AYH3_MELEN